MAVDISSLPRLLAPKEPSCMYVESSETCILKNNATHVFLQVDLVDCACGSFTFLEGREWGREDGERTVHSVILIIVL